MGKKFVILEVRKADGGEGIAYYNDTEQWTPKDGKRGEIMRLHPSRIIDGLYYGIPTQGTQFWNPYNNHWQEGSHGSTLQCLMTDPPPLPQTDLDRVLDQAPACIGSEAKAWVRDSLVPFLKKE